MHFSDISKAIKDSDFKRKNVTTQAIHNELIKDSRFILIGRGIYALGLRRAYGDRPPERRPGDPDPGYPMIWNWNKEL